MLLPSFRLQLALRPRARLGLLPVEYGQDLRILKLRQSPSFHLWHPQASTCHHHHNPRPERPKPRGNPHRLELRWEAYLPLRFLHRWPNQSKGGLLQLSPYRLLLHHRLQHQHSQKHRLPHHQPPH